MMSSADTGSGETGIGLAGHLTGNPLPESISASANVTIAHTWFIVVIALILLWLFGGAIFKNIRM
jgi:hypothetical protein